MSFSWDEFGDLAIWLEAERPSEAGQRTAINRAYDAAYHAASTFVHAHALCPPDQHLSHDRVWRLVRDSGRVHGAEVAKFGFALHDARVRAEYGNPYWGHLVYGATVAIAIAAALVAQLQAM